MFLRPPRIDVGDFSPCTFTYSPASSSTSLPVAGRRRGLSLERVSSLAPPRASASLPSAAPGNGRAPSSGGSCGCATAGGRASVLASRWGEASLELSGLRVVSRSEAWPLWSSTACCTPASELSGSSCRAAGQSARVGGGSACLCCPRCRPTTSTPPAPHPPACVHAPASGAGRSGTGSGSA